MVAAAQQDLPDFSKLKDFEIKPIIDNLYKDFAKGNSEERTISALAIEHIAAKSGRSITDIGTHLIGVDKSIDVMSHLVRLKEHNLIGISL